VVDHGDADEPAIDQAAQARLALLQRQRSVVDAVEGWSRDVSEDIANEVLERAFDADDNLSEETKRFIDRYVTPGEKRPPAPSVRRGDDQAIRKKA
jgi:hypothetical protein